MQFIFKSSVVNYDFNNRFKNSTILFLHGFGGNKNSFCQLNKLAKDFNTISITMPTTEPEILIWNLSDYANLVSSILKARNIEKVVVVCHSFGFRVACLLKDKINIEKIIVTGGAGIKNFNIFTKINQNYMKIMSKTPNFKFFFEKYASADYKALSPINKQTFKNIVNFDCGKLLKFNCPMFLFWGNFDTATPLSFAKKILKQNKQNCKKLVVTNSDHFAYIKQTNLFCNYALKFLKNEDC